jgi:hypothetical protein
MVTDYSFIKGNIVLMHKATMNLKIPVLGERSQKQKAEYCKIAFR